MNLNKIFSADSTPGIDGPLVLRLNICFALGFLAYVTLFAQIFSGAGQPLYVLIVATAALNVGAVIGFLYSTFGDEEAKFSKMFLAVNGVLGGATLTDLLKKDNSLLVSCLKQITVGCGLEEKSMGLVLVIIITCVPVGFFWLYFNRKLVLNPLMHLASKSLREANEVLNQKPLQVNTDPDMAQPAPDPEVVAAAKIITKSGPPADPGNVGSLINVARSFYELKDFDQAVSYFQKALAIRPNQPEALVASASALLESGENLQAIPVLEKLVGLPIVPAIAWKLLGYAYLFYPDDGPDKTQKLEASVTASRKYIALEPDDWGAKLNLACAYGQLGPNYAGAVQEAVTLVREILENKPDWKQRCQRLTGGGQDFAQWAGVKEFMQLLE